MVVELFSDSGIRTLEITLPGRPAPPQPVKTPDRGLSTRRFHAAFGKYIAVWKTEGLDAKQVRRYFARSNGLDSFAELSEKQKEIASRRVHAAKDDPQLMKQLVSEIVGFYEAVAKGETPWD